MNYNKLILLLSMKASYHNLFLLIILGLLEEYQMAFLKQYSLTSFSFKNPIAQTNQANPITMMGSSKTYSFDYKAQKSIEQIEAFPETKVQNSSLLYQGTAAYYFICGETYLLSLLDAKGTKVANLDNKALQTLPYSGNGRRCSFSQTATADIVLIGYETSSREKKLALARIQTAQQAVSVLQSVEVEPVIEADYFDCLSINTPPDPERYFCFYANNTNDPAPNTQNFTWVYYNEKLQEPKKYTYTMNYDIIKRIDDNKFKKPEYFVYAAKTMRSVNMNEGTLSWVDWYTFDDVINDFDVATLEIDPLIIAKIQKYWVILYPNVASLRVYSTKFEADSPLDSNSLTMRQFAQEKIFSIYYSKAAINDNNQLYSIEFPPCLLTPSSPIKLKSNETYSQLSENYPDYSSPVLFILVKGRPIPNKVELRKTYKLSLVELMSDEGHHYDWIYILGYQLTQSDILDVPNLGTIAQGIYAYSGFCKLQFEVCYYSCFNCSVHSSDDNKHQCLACKKHYERDLDKCVPKCAPECQECKLVDKYEYACVSCALKVKNTNLTYYPDLNITEVDCYTQKELDESFNSVDDIETKKDSLYQLYPDTPLIELPNCTVQIMDSSETDQGPSNVSRIHLGECENILRKNYIIPEAEKLIITKIDQVVESQLTNQVTYSVNRQSTGEKLNMSVCDENPVVIKSPINNMPEDLKKKLESFAAMNVDLYNKSDPFFNDRCSNYTSPNKTDVPLKDRRNDFSKNSSSLCADNCNYNGINLTDNTVSCQCFSNEEASAPTKDDFNNLLGSFLGVLQDSNFDVVNCFNLVFDTSRLAHNIGSWFVLSTISLCAINSMYFLFSQIGMLFPIFYKVVADLAANQKSAPHPKANPSKKTKKASKLTINSYSEEKNLKSKREFNFSSKSAKIAPIEVQKQFTIEDYNEMEFDEAINDDTRNYPKMYLGFLLMTQPILETFVYKSKKTLRSIKISMFFFGFVLDFSLSAFFYSDAYISNNYKGESSFLDSLPVSLYTYVFGMIISLLFNLLSNPASLDKLAKITDQDELMIKVKSYVTCYRVKLIFYFIFQLFFLCGFWYYVAAFCSVYQNSQTDWLISGFTSAGLSMALPFAFSIVLSLLRYISIRCKSKWLFCFISILMIVIGCV